MPESDRRLEAIIRCPRCNEEHFKLYSIATRTTGHRTNHLEPTPQGQDHKFCCRCGAVLERGPAG